MNSSFQNINLESFKKLYEDRILFKQFHLLKNVSDVKDPSLRDDGVKKKKNKNVYELRVSMKSQCLYREMLKTRKTPAYLTFLQHGSASNPDTDRAVSPNTM